MRGGREGGGGGREGRRVRGGKEGGREGGGEERGREEGGGVCVCGGGGCLLCIKQEMKI